MNTKYYYKATLQYDGTGYFGFQWQKGIPTIQNDFNLSLAKVLNGKITTMGASRTDTGVHAVEQFIKITSENAIDCSSFITNLQKELPAQIRCIDIHPCEGSLNPTISNGSKEYRYLFTNTPRSTCLDRRFIANNPYNINIELMEKCAKEIIGKKSFQNFCSAGSNVKTTERLILAADITAVDPREVLPQTDLFLIPDDVKTCYQFRIEGSGFLKQMVRHLMSALWLVGSGKISPNEFSDLLNGPLKEKRLWKVASPRGLFLYKFKHRI